MPTTGLSFLRGYGKRVTDDDPPGDALEAYPRIGENWLRPPARAGAAFLDTVPLESPEVTKRVYRFTAAVIALAVTVALTYCGIFVLDHLP